MSDEVPADLDRAIREAMAEKNRRYMRFQSTHTLKLLIEARPGPGDYWKPYAQAELDKREGRTYGKG